MNKKNFNVVGNNETENQELAKGIAWIVNTFSDKFF